MRLLVAATRAWRDGSGEGAAAKAGRRDDVNVLGLSVRRSPRTAGGTRLTCRGSSARQSPRPAVGTMSTCRGLLAADKEAGRPGPVALDEEAGHPVVVASWPFADNSVLHASGSVNGPFVGCVAKLRSIRN